MSSHQPGPSNQPNPSTPSPNSKNANFSSTHRLWFFYFLGVARTLLRTDHTDVDPEVFSMAQGLLNTHKELVKLPRIPQPKSIKTIWETFISRGTVERDQTKTGRKPLQIKDDIHTIMEAAIKEKRSVSLREMKELLTKDDKGPSLETIRKNLKKLKMRYYVTPTGQVLTKEHIKRRANFADRMQHQIAMKHIDPTNIAYTDECMLVQGQWGNRKNDGFWRISRQMDRADLLQQKQHRGCQVHMFVLVHAQAGVIGPYFIDEVDCQEDNNRKTLTSRRYIALLRDKVIPELKRRLGRRRFSTCWFQQDGAAPHTAKETLDYLAEEFGSNIISNKTDFEWPPHSPDLNPLDYWFWARMKQFIKKMKDAPKNEAQLKLAAKRACAQITLEETSRSIGSFNTRIRAVIDLGGAHFEHNFKSWKTIQAQSLPQEPCKNCLEVHQCACKLCRLICSQDSARRAAEVQEVEMEFDDELPDLERLAFDFDFDRQSLSDISSLGDVDEYRDMNIE